ncbi:SH3 domain-binding glutamic acid-rich protein-like isoform X1 [Amphibalanus amphitrite]|uniref:SH3 domain-binding glutamic acid-rich protein-like isoform X1 n=1 Tax=Amphibalanus amphitrite TaxID=1232801 RepID=UPI001C9218A7|nr:SH3 domain-binding glutamic acid-rich protein-like isoform X1 [Amphibalanus amphitrite]
MTIKIYVSGLSGNYEVKKRQQRIQTVLDSCAIAYELIDITEAGCEDERKFMQETAKAKEGDRNPLPPQIFNDKDYCGDYDAFDYANETDQLHQFLKLSEGEVNTAQDILSANRRASIKEHTTAENGLDETPNGDQTDAKEEPSFWDEKKEEDDSPGFWDEKKDEDNTAKDEKAEDDSPGFWDQKEGSPVKEVKKDEDDSPGFWDQKEESPVKEVKKEENECPGFWDEQGDNEKNEERSEEVKPSEDVEAEHAKDEGKESESEEEEEEEEDDDESPDIAELKDVAQKLYSLVSSSRCSASSSPQRG